MGSFLPWGAVKPHVPPRSCPSEELGFFCLQNAADLERCSLEMRVPVIQAAPMSALQSVPAACRQGMAGQAPPTSGPCSWLNHSSTLKWLVPVMPSLTCCFGAREVARPGLSTGPDPSWAMPHLSPPSEETHDCLVRCHRCGEGAPLRLQVYPLSVTVSESSRTPFSPSRNRATSLDTDRALFKVLAAEL